MVPLTNGMSAGEQSHQFGDLLNAFTNLAGLFDIPPKTLTPDSCHCSRSGNA